MAQKKTEIATFGAGCFWGVEEAFRKVPGVIDVAVGYTGGTSENPTYEDVCSGKTGHTEAVEIEYDSEKVSYKELLRILWKIHDPTQFEKQGPDVGYQYRSAIFFHNENQKKDANESKEEEDANDKYETEIVTSIEPAKTFWRGEEYHQRYFEKHGGGACHV